MNAPKLNGRVVNIVLLRCASFDSGERPGPKGEVGTAKPDLRQEQNENKMEAWPSRSPPVEVGWPCHDNLSELYVKNAGQAGTVEGSGAGMSVDRL
jgi:hypothetical protein